MTKLYDYAVVIMRAQPFHNGHLALIHRASGKAKNVIVLIGSVNSPRSIKNPFTYEERKHMIQFESSASVRPLSDFKYNDQKWIANVQKTVYDTIISCEGDNCNNKSIALIGLNKDDSTRYLNWFPTWDFIETEPVDQQGLDATSIREILFSGKKNLSFIQGVVPQTVFDFIREVKGCDWWKMLEEEYSFIEKYKAAWATAPYPPIFVTVDSVVVQDGHVLLVKRGASPGKGLLALPGGFINQNERIQDAVIRELREETRIKVPEPVLRGSIVCSDVFDAVDRSLRGRTITHAFLIKLASTGSLPVVKGGDDAEKAFWVPISSLDERTMFEDHFSVVQSMVDKI